MAERNNRNSRDDKSNSGERRTRKRTDSDRPERPNNRFSDRKEGSKFGDRREGDKSSFGNKDFKPRNDRSDKGDSKKPWEKDSKPRAFKAANSTTGITESKRSYIKKDGEQGAEGYKAYLDKRGEKGGEERPFRKREDPFRKREESSYRKRDADTPREKVTTTKKTNKNEDDLIRLNRYIANSGICSRRKADELIAAGVISVNKEVVTELGHKIDPYKDEIRYNGELLKREKKIYVLLNKPKDYITTTDDPQERRTVMQLVDKASKERIYPVGRLDRNTTGLLLMTNDGDLAEKLSHPRNSITKIYHVELSRNLTQGDFNKIEFGLELEDGIIKPDNLSYVAGASKKEIGIQIHSGKNRIVRRIFEHLGYDVVKLDRVVYGSLTKKDLPRGRWRYLDEHELIQIKHLMK